MLAEQLARKLAGITITGDATDAIGFQQRRKVMDHRIRRKRRAGLANRIDDDLVLGLVRDRQREAVIGAAARICESSVKVVRCRQHLAVGASAGLDNLERDEALDIGAELREIFSRRAGAVLLQRAVDDPLWQRRIERSARTVSHEDERVSARAVMAA